MDGWPEPVERVAAYVRAAAADARIEEFGEGTPTAEAAALAVGCGAAEIVKSLVFVCDERLVLALVPGDRRASAEKVAAAAQAARARIAGHDDVRSGTGYEPGAVAPFPLRAIERVVAERTLLDHEVVWAGAGSPRHMLAIAPSDLIRLARATPADLLE